MNEYFVPVPLTLDSMPLSIVEWMPFVTHHFVLHELAYFRFKDTITQRHIKRHKHTHNREGVEHTFDAPRVHDRLQFSISY
jgi:hypothetical protein